MVTGHAVLPPISLRKLLLVSLPLVSLASSPAIGGSSSHDWLRISSDHFTVLTDAGEKRGHEVAARFEQMRAVFGELLLRRKLKMGKPLDIIALRSDQDYAQLAPLSDGQPISAAGFFLSGEDRIYIVLNLFQPDSWRAIEHPFAHYLLNYNYPPTQAWFDEGFAEYFASLELTGKQAELGADPELRPAYETDLLGSTTGPKGLSSLTEILSNPVWLAWPDLLTMSNRVVKGEEGTHHTLFFAQSWMLVHYLVNRHKLDQTGVYFDRVENQRLAPEEALRQAFGMSFVELDREVKDYFHSLAPLFDALDESKRPGMRPEPFGLTAMPLPLVTEDVATSSKSVPLAQAQALIAEMKLRIPERQEQAFQELSALASDAKTETAAAHRALAWAYVQRGNTGKAFEELNSAVQINPSDPWTRFGLALASYHSGQKGARVQGLANMMESLHIVIAEFADFAEAYHLLGWARLQGGGANAAVEALEKAVALSPRQEQYRLELARAYLAAHKFTQASSLLEALKSSQDSTVQRAAKKSLVELPFLEKYGVPPQAAEQEENAAAAAPPKPSGDKSAEQIEEESAPKPASSSTTLERRPVKFIKARLLSVDCSHPPAATLEIAEGGQTLKLRTSDFNSVAVIGADRFSCAWKNLPAKINYRAGGKLDGDLVSIEVD
jgi:Tfp pilus assembly protein PilF